MNDMQLLLEAALAAIVAGASLFGLYSIIRQKRRQRQGTSAIDETEPLPYRRVEALLTPGERALYRILRPIAEGAGADVFAKVRLDDVVQVRKGAAAYETHRSQIGACGIDFLLCDRERLAPLLALQMDGIARERASREEHEQKLADALDTVGIPCFKIPAQASYDAEEIAALVHEQLAAAPVQIAPDDAPAARYLQGPEPEDAQTALYPDELAPEHVRATLYSDNLVPEDLQAALYPDGLAPEDVQASDQAYEAAEAGGMPYWLDAEPALAAGSEAGGMDGAAGDASLAFATSGEEADEGVDPLLRPEPLLDATIDSPPEPEEPEDGPAPEDGPPAVDLEEDVPALAGDLPALSGYDAVGADVPALSDGVDATGSHDEAPPADAPAAFQLAEDEIPCPTCGQPLVPMQDVDTGEIVLACSHYPECGYVGPVSS